MTVAKKWNCVRASSRRAPSARNSYAPPMNASSQRDPGSIRAAGSRGE
ncbi:Uncharacterised protein [Mycobacteroides abscessus]|nr:Uncharacterised protein [Mycobacteroides abscessus]